MMCKLFFKVIINFSIKTFKIIFALMKNKDTEGLGCVLKRLQLPPHFNTNFRNRLFPKWIFKWPASSGSTGELIAALRRFKGNCDHTSWPEYFTRRPDRRPKTTLTLFCPHAQSRRQRSTAIRSSTSKAGVTSIWPASCCKRRNHHPSSIGEFGHSPLTIDPIEFVPLVFRHNRVLWNPNLQ